jgi:glycosyltransferase involved in cell wall biosynthesis
VVSECCADELFLTPIESRGRRSNEGAIRLVGLGNIVRWKNWHLLLEAIARLPESSRRRIEFHHWGPTPNDPDSLAYERELRDYVRASGLDRNCHFRGVSLRVAEVLRDADWFVLPSTNEPCSVALIEALACGVPAVVSASGGNVDIIRPNATGLLFAPDSSPDLAAKLDNILEGRARMAAPAELRESVRQRSASAVADQFLTIYRRIQWN